MFDRDEAHPKVLKMRPTTDLAGEKLRREGPCYVCNAPTKYRYSGYQSHYGDAWLDKQFVPEIREARLKRMRKGAFIRGRGGNGNVLLRQLLKFTCQACLDDFETRLWPEYERYEREMRATYGCWWHDPEGGE